MSSSSSTNSGRVALLQALPILIFTMLFGIILVFLAWRGVRNADDLSVDSREFAQYARVCEGTALPVAAVFDRQTPTHPTVVFHESPEGWLLDRAVIPADALPTSLGEVQLVLCVSLPEEISLASCSDNLSLTQETVTGTRLSLRLLAAGTGAVIMQHSLRPVADMECWPADLPAPPAPTQEDIWFWLRPFVIASE